MRIALAGNPNSGKTTMYNALTGRNEKTGNWAGVTVDKKESLVKKLFTGGTKEVTAVDLPGAYSMSPFTSEESITSGYVKNEHPDALINIVDASNLSRSLFFTTQLLELGIPVVIALNKMDLNRKAGTEIDTCLLSEKLGCPVIETVATSSQGIGDAVKMAVSLMGSGQKAPFVQDMINLTDKRQVEEEDRKRFVFVSEVVAQVETRKVPSRETGLQDRVDAVLTSRWIGIPVFAAVMSAVFYLSQTTVGKWIADWLVGWIEVFQGWAGAQISGASPFVQALLIDGIIGGVGAVVGFLPLVMVMYFLLALLEDCGYMARATVVLDPIFKRVGLSGRSVIPMIIGTGCAIPGIMAARTIRSERERRATAMLTPFMPCGAKIPVIVLFAGAFFGNAWWVSPLMYFSGIVLILLGSLLVKVVTGQKYRKSFFIIELPAYRVPDLPRAALSMMSRGRAYIRKAATIILVCNAVVQIMQTFDWNFQPVAEGAEHTSILASAAAPFAVLLIPLGFGVWQLAAAAITGFIAKENVVGTLAVVYSMTNLIDPDALEMTGSASSVAAVMGLSKAAAMAYLVFNLFTPPCFAAIGAMNAEMQNRKWLWAGIGLQLGTGYTAAFLVYQIGTLVATGSPGVGFLPGLYTILAMMAVVFFLIVGNRKKFAGKYQFS